MTHADRAPWAIVVAAVMVCAACGGGGETDDLAPSDVPRTSAAAPTSTVSPAPTTQPPTTSPERSAPRSPLAGKVSDIGGATYDPAEHRRDEPIPAQLSVAGIDVDSAQITSVGVLPDGRFEVPDATVVGWYRFGPTPLEAGSTVLAAHLNYDGVNGVFRYLADVDVGAEVSVTLTDGQVASYRVTEVRLIDKNLLPPDEIWNRDGPARLVLITCGGRYDAARRSYDDNVVVFADPV